MEIVGDGLDLVFSNEEEAKLMFDAKDMNECVAGMKTIARQFAITQGAQGATLYDGETLYDLPAESVKPVDTNGAGDIYAGAFLHGLTNDMPFERCGELAGAAATTLIQQLGARLTPEQMQAVGKRAA